MDRFVLRNHNGRPRISRSLATPSRRATCGNSPHVWKPADLNRPTLGALCAKVKASSVEMPRPAPCSIAWSSSCRPTPAAAPQGRCKCPLRPFRHRPAGHRTTVATASRAGLGIVSRAVDPQGGAAPGRTRRTMPAIGDADRCEIGRRHPAGNRRVVDRDDLRKVGGYARHGSFWGGFATDGMPILPKGSRFRCRFESPCRTFKDCVPKHALSHVTRLFRSIATLLQAAEVENDLAPSSGGFANDFPAQQARGGRWLPARDRGDRRCVRRARADASADARHPHRRHRLEHQAGRRRKRAARRNRDAGRHQADRRHDDQRNASLHSERRICSARANSRRIRLRVRARRTSSSAGWPRPTCSCC